MKHEDKDAKDAKDDLEATAKAAADLKPDEAETMRLRKLSPAERAKRIAEITAELELLKLPPYQEYPKVLEDGRTVHSAAEEHVKAVTLTDDAHAKKSK